MNKSERKIERGIAYLKRIGIGYLKKTLQGHAPDFIIAGAQKSGTTSLHYYLSQHPNLLASTPKEIHYFDRDYNFKKGKKWYHHSFINLNSDKKNYLCFEATPDYMYRAFAAERMHQQYPNLKIIIVLREPVKRAYSAWNMFKHYVNSTILLRILVPIKDYIQDRQNNNRQLYKAKNFPSFEEVVASEILKIEQNSEFEEPSFLRRGIYFPQIKRLYDLFGKNQVLVLGFNDLKQYQIQTLNKVLKFLDLQESDWNFLNDNTKNAKAYPEKISKEMEEKLTLFYEPYNKLLFDYLGYKINW